MLDSTQMHTIFVIGRERETENQSLLCFAVVPETDSKVSEDETGGITTVGILGEFGPVEAERGEAESPSHHRLQS